MRNIIILLVGLCACNLDSHLPGSHLLDSHLPDSHLPELDPFAQRAYIKASNTGIGDEFGAAVALSADGSTLAVSSWLEDSAARGIAGNQADNSARDSGAVFIYVRTGETWMQQAYVKASNTDPVDHFGSSIALSADGTTLVVGATGESSSAIGIDGDQSDNAAGSSGAVYVFTRSDTTWTQQAYVKSSNTDPGDLFGHSIALSADGSTLAVGAILESSSATGIDGDQSENLALRSGAVYVFTRFGVRWTQQVYIKASNTNAGDLFGQTVALSRDGSTLAVGAYLESSAASGVNNNQDDNSAGGAGAAYVFARTGVTWSQQAYIKASNPDVADLFGFSVSLSGDGSVLAVGAPQEDSAATGVGGLETDNSSLLSGAAYIFRRTDVTWSQEAYIKASNTDPSDHFGSDVKLSPDGATLAAGARNESSSAPGIDGNQADNLTRGSGAVYLFERGGTTWRQRSYVKPSNPGSGDAFGVRIALSNDTLVSGGSFEDSAAIGVDGPQADESCMGGGAVYVFQ